MGGAGTGRAPQDGHRSTVRSAATIWREPRSGAQRRAPGRRRPRRCPGLTRPASPTGHRCGRRSRIAQVRDPPTGRTREHPHGRSPRRYHDDQLRARGRRLEDVACCANSGQARLAAPGLGEDHDARPSPGQYLPAADVAIVTISRPAPIDMPAIEPDARTGTDAERVDITTDATNAITAAGVTPASIWSSWTSCPACSIVVDWQAPPADAPRRLDVRTVHATTS